MEKLKRLMSQVFDSKGNIKPCGREVCKALIKQAKRLYPGPNYGDETTGFMKVDNLLKLRDQIK